MTDIFGTNRQEEEEQKSSLLAAYNRIRSLEPGPTGTQGTPQGFLGKLLTVFDPLLLPGDVAKSFIYGAVTTGSLRGGFEMARRQLADIATYAPGGTPARQLVRGDDLARLFVGNYDEMPAWKKFTLGLAMDVATDPLSVFGLAGVATKGASIAARAARVAPVAEVLEGAARGLFKADVAVQGVLNPYTVAARGARAIGQINLGPLSAYRPVAEVVSDTFSSVMELPIAKRQVRLPDGTQSTVTLRIGDFILPFFTPKEARELEGVLPKYLGSRDTGPGILLRAKAYYQDVMQIGIRHIEDIHATLHEALGVQAIGSRRIIPQERLPLAKEILAQTWKIIDEHGVADAGEALTRAKENAAKLARAYGVQEDVATKAVEDIYNKSRLAFLDMTYITSGMPFYERVFKGVAKEMGVDPEEAWQRYLGMRAGYAPILGEDGRLIELRKAPEPTVPSLRSLAYTPQQEKAAARAVAEDGTTLNLRYFALLSPTAQAEVLGKSPKLGEALGAFNRAINEVAENYDKFVEEFDPLGLARRIFGERGTLKKRSLDELQKDFVEGRLLNFIGKSEVFMGNIGADDISRLVSSGNKRERALGYTILGMGLERSGMYHEAVMAYTLAADEAPSVIAQYLYSSGALGISVKEGIITAPKVNVPKDIATILAKNDGLSSEEIRRIVEWTRGAQGIREDLGLVVANMDTPGAKFLKALLTRNRESIAAFIGDALAGRVGVKPDGLDFLKLLGVRLGVIEDVGEPLEKVRARIADTLLTIEQRALTKYWEERPFWAGMSDPGQLFGQTTGKGWQGSPFSPLQWFANIKEGYARKLYIGTANPEAARAAIVKGKLSLIPEINPEAAVEAGVQYLQRFGKSGPEVRAALNDLAEYIANTGGRYVYTAEALMKLLSARGLTLSQEEFNGLLNAISNTGAMEEAALRVIAQKEMGDPRLVPSPPARGLPRAFGARVSGADLLVQLMDPMSSMAELTRYAARHLMAAHVQNELYKVLQEAGLIFDELPESELRNLGRLKFTKVPDEVVKDAAGTAYRPYGPLSGKYIPTPIFEHMIRAMSTDPLSGGAYAAFLTFWRRALLNNPKTVLVNAVGNAWLTYATQGPEFAVEAVRAIPEAVRAMEIYNRTGRLPGIAEGAIHFIKEASLSQEVRGVVNDAIRRITGVDPDTIRKGAFQRFIERVDAYVNDFGSRLAEALGKEGNHYLRMLAPIEVFAYVENVQRLANYIAAKRMGKSTEEALWIAANATHNYTEVPYAIRLARDYGLVAFPSFMYLTAKALARTATQTPSAITLPLKAAQMSFYSVPENTEERVRINAYMSRWLRDSLPAVLPIKREDGSYVVIPLNYLFPIAPIDPLGLGEEIFSGGVLRPFIEAATGLMRWAEGDRDANLPIWSRKYGHVMFKDNATAREAILGSLSYVATQFMPSYATRFLPVADLPELVAMRMGDASAMAKVRSVVGKLVVQYSNPAVVAELERRTGRAIGYTPVEGLVAMVANPRRVSPDPVGVGSRDWMQLDRKLKDLKANITKRALRGEPMERLAEEYKREAAKLIKEIEPYLAAGEMFGEPGGE